MNAIEQFKNGRQIRKMQTAAGGPLTLPGKSQKEVDETNNYNRNKAKGLFKGIISGKILPTINNIGSMLGAAYNGWLDPETTITTGDVPNPGMRDPKQIFKVFTGVPKKYLESFPTYKGEIWAGPTAEAVQAYAKNGKVFPIRYETNGVRILDVDSKEKISKKGIKLADVPEDILKLYNEAGIQESPVYMSLYNLSKFANKIKPTVIRAKNVKDAKKGIFDYTIIGENVPRTIIKKQGGKMNAIEQFKRRRIHK